MKCEDCIHYNKSSSNLCKKWILPLERDEKPCKHFEPKEDSWADIILQKDDAKQLIEQLSHTPILDDEIRKAMEEDMSEVGVEIIKTEEAKENGIKYLNINASNSEVERNPDIVRLCADARILEYVKRKTGHWILDETDNSITCNKCGCLIWANDISNGDAHYCPNCGARMVEPQESEGV